MIREDIEKGKEGLKIEVVNAGNCMICGKPIKLAVPIDYNKLPDIFFCRKCGPELKYDLKRPEREEDG